MIWDITRGIKTAAGEAEVMTNTRYRPISTPSRADIEVVDRASSRAIDMSTITAESKFMGVEATA